MSFNLLRNSRVFFTTAVGTSGANLGVIGATGVGAAPAIDSTNTREIQVLDGFGFSQNTTSETVTLSETGASPVRGQRSFNTQLDPVDFNMTTYIRPYDNDTIITAEESVLWNALLGVDAIGGTAPAWTNGDSTATPETPATVVATSSNQHQLQRFGLIIVIDKQCFLIDDCVLNTATLDFGIDAIASIQWAGQAKNIRQVAGPTAIGAGTFTGAGVFNATGFTQKITAAGFISNKLSVVTMRKGIGGGSGAYYNVPLTGGNLTISNNVSYLTPANLGIVNRPATYFTGTRAVSGSLNAYLRTGVASGVNDTDNASTGRKETGQLWGDLLTDSLTDVDPAYYIKIAIGGSSAQDRVEIELPGCVLTIPTLSTEQVISTTINFTAQATASGDFALEEENEINVKYYA